jgi:transposase
MYLRITQRTNRDGSTVRYFQLAHNVRNPTTGVATARVLYNFGREDRLDREALERLVRSIRRVLSPERQLETSLDEDRELRFVSSRPMGGALVLDALWSSLGIRGVLEGLLADRRFAVPVERVLFALVANRALAPSSKLAIERWVAEETVIAGLETVAVQQLYRAMDFLLGSDEAIQREVFFSVAHLLNLEVDLLFFDTTSTYFEVEEEDAFRRFGYSRDRRDDRPQAVIGLAVTREGIPVRCWSWPGNTADVSVVEEVKRDLVGWRLGRVVTVLDRGFVSEHNLKTLQRAGGHYIVGERLQSGKHDIERVVSRPGTYRHVRDNVEVKEVVVGVGEARRRYVVVRNPQETERDRQRRERTVKDLEERLTALRRTKGQEHTKAHCALRSHPVYGRYLTTTPSGALRIDRAKLKDEARLDGKYVLRTSDDTLSSEDVALGYKQLIEVEDAFRTLKQKLELRPVYHRLEERIRAHVLLCWLALLLVRVIEIRTARTWPTLRQAAQQMHLGRFEGAAGHFQQRTETTAEQRHVFKALGIEEPPMVTEATTATPTPPATRRRRNRKPA